MMRNRFTNKIQSYILMILMLVMSMFTITCQKETLQLNPGFNPTAVYKFSIDPPYGTQGLRTNYTIKGYSLIVSDTLSNAPNFLLRGRDSINQVDIVISARSRSSTSEVNLNVNIEGKTIKKFYNNCNFATGTVQRGKNSKGNFIKLILQSNIYITQKLVSERNMQPECVTGSFDVINYIY